MDKEYMTQWYEKAKVNAKDEKERKIIEAKYKMFLSILPKEK